MAGDGEDAADAFQLGEYLAQLVETRGVEGELHGHCAVLVFLGDHRGDVDVFLGDPEGDVPQQADPVVGPYLDPDGVEVVGLAPVDVDDAVGFVLVAQA